MYGRSPHRPTTAARDLSETDDLVQDTLTKTVRNLTGFVADGEAGFQNYVRPAIGNAIRDEIRKARRRSSSTPPRT